jgi:hypothetical protein
MPYETKVGFLAFAVELGSGLVIAKCVSFDHF